MTENTHKSEKTPSKIPRPFRPFGIPLGGVEPFALEALAERLPQEEAYRRDGRTSLALARSSELTVVLTAIRAGSKTLEHLSPGPATVVVLSGRLRFSAPGGGAHELGVHDSILFAADVRHAVDAVTDCVFLLVIGGKQPAS